MLSEPSQVRRRSSEGPVRFRSDRRGDGGAVALALGEDGDALEISHLGHAEQKRQDVHDY